MLDLWPCRAAGLILLAVLTACGGSVPEADQGPPDQTYSLRGKVVQLPSAREKEISIYHESIPGFIGADGEAVGMDAMTMPFTLDADASLDGIHKGDKISFELDVRWEGNDIVTVRQLQKLPDDTVLGFERPGPDAEDASGDGEAEDEGPETEDGGSETDAETNAGAHDHAH